MADHTGGIGNGIGAIDDGRPDRIPERQPIRVGLGGLIIIVTQGTAIASGPAMQLVDVVLIQQTTGTGRAKDTGVTGMAPGTGQSTGTKIDASIIMLGGLMIRQILTVTYDTVPTTVGAANSAAVFTRCGTDKPSIDAMTACAGMMDPRRIRVNRIPGCCVTIGAVTIHTDHAVVTYSGMIAGKGAMAG